jgi:hypothetical protein
MVTRLFRKPLSRVAGKGLKSQVESEGLSGFRIHEFFKRPLVFAALTFQYFTDNPARLTGT